MRSLLIISLIASAFTLTYGSGCVWNDSNGFIKQRLTKSNFLAKTEVRDGKTFYLLCEDQDEVYKIAAAESNQIIPNESNDGFLLGVASGSSSGSSSSGSKSTSSSSSSSKSGTSSSSNSNSSPANSKTSSANSKTSSSNTNNSPVKTNPAPKPAAPVANPPAPKPAAPVANPPAPKPAAPVANPPAPKPAAPVANPPAPKPAEPVANPPAPKPAAPVANPPAPKPPGPAVKANSQTTVTLTEFQKAVQASYPKAKVTQDKVDSINKYAEQYGGIKTKQELAMFIAQTAKESMGYKYTTEIGGSKKAYGQKDPVTGQSYYGRGYIQLTGKENYRQASMAIFGDDRLVKNPDLVNEDDINWKVSFNYWKENVHSNAAVQAGHFDKTTILINGKNAPIETINERYTIYEKTLKELGVDATPIR